MITLIPKSLQLIKMTDAEYFSAKYKDYISNSRLGYINPKEGGSEEKYALGVKSTFSESFELGTAIHSMLLQPDFYHIAEITKPTGKLGIFAEEVFQLRQQGLSIKLATEIASQNVDYYASKLSSARLKTAIKKSLSFYLNRMKFKGELGKQPLFLSEPIKQKFEKSMLGIAANPKIHNTLYPTGLLEPCEYFNEYAILGEAEYIDEDTGEITILKLKAKLDNFTINHETGTITLNDLKSTSKPVAYFMGNYVKEVKDEETINLFYPGSFQKYHYYRQIGMYIWMLQCAITELYGYNYKLKANILVIETDNEFKSKVFPINGNYVKAGLDELKYLLKLVAQWNQKKS